MTSVQRYLFKANVKGYLQKCLLCGYTTRYLSNESIRKDAEEFCSYLPEFTQIVMDYTKQFDQKVAARWFERMLRYNLYEELPGRGILTYVAYKAIANETQLSEENLKLVRNVAWCSKLIEASGVVSDDYIDQAKRRRSLPCWYTLPDVGYQFTNDIAMLTIGAYGVLRKTVGHKNYYLSLLDLFNDATVASIVGQTLDTLYAREGILHHTREKYEHMVELKLGLFGNYFPIAIALQMCGNKDPKMYSSCKEVMLEIGQAWQMRNDYLDCFGKSTGITRTDIEENKITWLSVNFMERATEIQKQYINECYGSYDPAQSQRVKALYKEVEVDKSCLDEEKIKYVVIQEKIDASPCQRLNAVYHYFCDKIFNDYVKL